MLRLGQVIITWLNVRLTPLQTWQYFGAAVLDLATPLFNTRDMAFLFHMLSFVRQQNFLLPIDVCFLIDPERVKLTGNVHVPGRVSMYGMYALLRAAHVRISQKDAQTDFENADVESKNSLR